MTDAECRFTAVYEAYQPKLYAYCRRRLTSHAAEDAVAEIFLIAWRKIDELPNGKEALLWLYRVAYLTVGHQWRSRSRRNRLETKMASIRPRHGVVPEEVVLQSDQMQRVLKAASRLKPKDHEVLRLSIWEELSHADIGHVLDMSPEAVAQRFYRAKKALTKELNRSEQTRQQTLAAQEGGAQ